VNLKTILIAATLGALACGGAVSAASAQPLAHPAAHPRQAQVLHRAADQRAAIRHEAATGRVAPAKARRLMVGDHRMVREEHRMARANGGHLTKVQAHRLNRQETRLDRRIHG